MSKEFSIHPDARARQVMLDGTKSRAYTDAETDGCSASLDRKETRSSAGDETAEKAQADSH
jgi:hypothetical protein